MTQHNDIKNELYFYQRDIDMDSYELSEHKDRCTYGIEAIRSCRLCLFNTLCNLERNSERNTLKSNQEEWKKKNSDV